MNERAILLTSRRLNKRRSSQFRAVVETLDARQLMTAGFLPNAQPAGYAGTPLTVYEYDDTSIDLPPLIAPVGTPVPLVTLTSSTGPLSPAGYSGTVNWGDGSPVDAATFTAFTARSMNFLFDGLPPGQTLFVNGSDHTYAAPGTYSITVSVTAPGASAPTVSQVSVSIAAPPISISGQLNPFSDSGVSNTDGITDINTPNFFGKTQPGATVVLSASSSSNLGTTPIPLGTTVADVSGNWSITAAPLFDGNYFVSATATGQFGASATAGVGPATPFGELVIDTIGPKIAGFQMISPNLGSFKVGFTDPYGLLIAPLIDLNNYSTNRPSPTPRKGQKFPVGGLIYSTVPFGPTAMTTSIYPVLVTGDISGRQPLIPHNGTYTFTIRSAGITSVSGAPLDGEYTGKFLTGDGHPGGDFQVKINVRNGKASGPIAITPVKATVHPGKVKASVAARRDA